MADGNPKITFLGGGTEAYAWINENTVNVGVYTAIDQDHPADPITWSITGGDDAALFEIDEDTGVLDFIAAPDFENPLPDNVYQVEVHAENDNGPGDDQLLFVQVLDVNAEGAEGPQGPAGPAGPQGPQGPSGEDGTDGTDGTDGPQGPAGPSGEPGPSGADGTDGAPGPAGPAGVDGTDGQDGAAGPAGPPGVDGTDGINGKDAVDLSGNYIKGTRKANLIDANSLIPATEQNDIILGKNGKDQLYGLGGNDAIVAGKAKDFIVGGTGNDLLWAGRGRDEFAFATGDGDDIIRFDPKRDHLNLALTAIHSFGELQNHMTEVGNRVLISFDSGDSILIGGGNTKGIGSLHDSDFIF